MGFCFMYQGHLFFPKATNAPEGAEGVGSVVGSTPPVLLLKLCFTCRLVRPCRESFFEEGAGVGLVGRPGGGGLFEEECGKVVLWGVGVKRWMARLCFLFVVPFLGFAPWGKELKGHFPPQAHPSSPAVQTQIRQFSDLTHSLGVGQDGNSASVVHQEVCGVRPFNAAIPRCPLD